MRLLIDVMKEVIERNGDGVEALLPEVEVLTGARSFLAQHWPGLGRGSRD